MKQNTGSLLSVYLMQGLAKGLSTSYFILLPIFYANKLLSPAAIGYVGGLFIGFLLVGAIVVARWIHNWHTKSLAIVAALVELTAALVLLGAAKHRPALIIAYCLMGLASGFAVSATGALAANLTVKGARFKAFAKVWMFVDIARIAFPAIIAGLYVAGGLSAAIWFVVVLSSGLLLLASRLSTANPGVPAVGAVEGVLGWRQSKPFSLMLGVEFLDSLASSQLFVYLPLLVLSKGHSLSSSLLLQTFVFVGYFCGRWLVGGLAERSSGPRAIGLAEAGMVISIMLLLIARPLWLLYGLSILFGIFARGTSPPIHALTFDTLEEHQIKQGSALHVIAGDSGSALGQLLFGLLITWYSIRAPFIAAMVFAIIVMGICFAKAAILTPMVQLDHDV